MDSMPRDASRFDALRSDVQIAAFKIGGYRRLHEACGWYDHAPATGSDNLERFANDLNATINARDAERLTAFFHDTDLGRILTGKGASPLHSTEHLLQTVRSGVQSANGHSLDGAYAIYHGSIMYEDHFTKLAATFTTLPIGAISGDIRYHDNLAAEPGTRQATANVIFRRSCVQILSVNNDNAEGFELIIGVPSYTSSGLVREIVGTVHGMNIRGDPYFRAVLIRRLPQPLTSAQLETTTGVRALSAWPADDQLIFRHLARSRLRPRFDDPTATL
jgi:hypothetical protein